MQSTMAVLCIAGALLIGAMSPGPSFLLVARTSIAASRRDGLAAALGMGVGGVIFGAFALLGLRAALTHVAWLYDGLRLLGAFYLVYLGTKIWRGAAASVTIPAASHVAPERARRSFLIGLGTQLSNPKTAVVYGSIFAALLPAAPPGWMLVALMPLIFAAEAGWYGLVAMAFSSHRPRGAYMRSKTWIDRLAGLVMGGLGLKLLWETARPRILAADVP